MNQILSETAKPFHSSFCIHHSAFIISSLRSVSHPSAPWLAPGGQRPRPARWRTCRPGRRRSGRGPGPSGRSSSGGPWRARRRRRRPAAGPPSTARRPAGATSARASPGPKASPSRGRRTPWPGRSGPAASSGRRPGRGRTAGPPRRTARPRPPPDRRWRRRGRQRHRPAGWPAVPDRHRPDGLRVVPQGPADHHVGVRLAAADLGVDRSRSAVGGCRRRGGRPGRGPGSRRPARAAGARHMTRDAKHLRIMTLHARPTGSAPVHRPRLGRHRVDLDGIPQPGRHGRGAADAGPGQRRLAEPAVREVTFRFVGRGRRDDRLTTIATANRRMLADQQGRRLPSRSASAERPGRTSAVRYMTTAVTISSASEIGISARQASIMSWSKRNRGRLQRTHMKMKMIADRLAEEDDRADDADEQAGRDRRVGAGSTSPPRCRPRSSRATAGASRRRTARRRRRWS